MTNLELMLAAALIINWIFAGSVIQDLIVHCANMGSESAKRIVNNKWSLLRLRWLWPFLVIKQMFK